MLLYYFRLDTLTIILTDCNVSTIVTLTLLLRATADGVEGIPLVVVMNEVLVVLKVSVN